VKVCSTIASPPSSSRQVFARAARPESRGCQRGAITLKRHPALREAIAALLARHELDRRTRSAAAEPPRASATTCMLLSATGR